MSRAGIRLGVNKLERVDRDHLGVKFFKLTVVEKHRQAFARADAKMITTVRTNLERLLEFAFVEVRFAAVTLDEDVLRFDGTLFSGGTASICLLFLC